MSFEVSAGDQPPAYRRRKSSTSWIYDISERRFIDVIDEYLKKEAANSKVSKYLRDFLNINHCCKLPVPCRAVFNVVSQQGSGTGCEDAPRQFELRGHDELQQYIKDMDPDDKSLSFCALIAENICPYSMCLLGVVFDIKPRFWATHFEKSYHTQEEDVDRWLLPLPSMSRERDVDSFNIEYVEPRELRDDCRPFRSMETIRTAVQALDGYKNYSTEDRPDKRDKSHVKTYSASVNREIQFLPARPPATDKSGEESSDSPVAFIPGPLSVKRCDSAGGATVMVVLIDPHTTHLDFKPNSHLDKGSDSETGQEEHVRVRKPRERMSHFLSKQDDKIENVAETAYRNIGRMIAKQWQLVHGYMYRDLDLIKRKLEAIPSFDTAEKLLNDLFRYQQNCTQYQKQMAETQDEFIELGLAIRLPAEADFEHLQRGFSRLAEVTDRNIKLLTDLTAIKEAQQGLDENHGITRLTHIATLYLPFSTVAAVLAMPDGFAPGAAMFWVYWVASAVLSALVLILVVLHRPLQSWWARISRQGDNGKDGVGLRRIGEDMDGGKPGLLARLARWRRRGADEARESRRFSRV